jgi:hypothetical protein
MIHPKDEFQASAAVSPAPPRWSRTDGAAVCGRQAPPPPILQKTKKFTKDRHPALTGLTRERHSLLMQQEAFANTEDFGGPDIVAAPGRIARPGQVDDLMIGGIAAFLADITKQCEQIHKTLYSSYITYGAETVL